MVRSFLWRAVSVAAVVLPAFAQAQAQAQSQSAQPNAELWGGLQEFARLATAQYQRIQQATQQAVASERGYGTCEMRAEALTMALPQAAWLADLNRDLYFHPYDADMWQKGLLMDTVTLPTGGSITVFRDPTTDGYAELYPPTETTAAVLIFRGTKVSSANDILANVSQFVGNIPPKYQWASNLTAQVVKGLNGARLILSGHSLGGGLAMYAGLKHDLPAITFNPAGLSKAAFDGIAESAIIQASERMTTYISRSGSVVDPVASLSLAGDSMIVGQRYVIEVNAAVNQLQIHDVGLLANRLQALVKEAPAMAPEDLCEYDLGARPVL